MKKIQCIEEQTPSVTHILVPLRINDRLDSVLVHLIDLCLAVEHIGWLSLEVQQAKRGYDLLKSELVSGFFIVSSSKTLSIFLTILEELGYCWLKKFYCSSFVPSSSVDHTWKSRTFSSHVSEPVDRQAQTRPHHFAAPCCVQACGCDLPLNKFQAVQARM
jgi:hypothetical protein